MRKRKEVTGENKAVEKVARRIVRFILVIQTRFAKHMGRLSGNFSARQLKVLTIVISAVVIGFSGYLIYGGIFSRPTKITIPPFDHTNIPVLLNEPLINKFRVDTSLISKLSRYREILGKDSLKTKDSFSISDQQASRWLDSIRILQQMILSNTK